MPIQDYGLVLWKYAGALIGFAAVMAPLTLLELLLPRQARLPLVRRAKGAMFWAPYVAVGVVILTVCDRIWKSFGVQALVHLPLQASLGWTGPLAPWIAAVAVIVFADFFGYWFHRVQHGPLWRFHKVHHSIRDVTAVNSYRHVSDEAFQYVMMSIPLSLVDLGPVATPWLVVGFMQMQAFFLHCDTRLGYGPVGWLFSDNRYHRIHHSLDPAHFNRNFGTVTTVWDRVFGTAYFPAKDEWPATGLEHDPEPADLVEFFLAPFRPQAGATAADGAAAPNDPPKSLGFYKSWWSRGESNP
jgi:sterol desaturase/sphingolipid hydroxylase (fatty acid hydroxylase superfamily)